MSARVQVRRNDVAPAVRGGLYCARCDRHKSVAGPLKEMPDRRFLCRPCERAARDARARKAQHAFFDDHRGQSTSLFDQLENRVEGFQDAAGRFHPIRASEGYNEFIEIAHLPPRKPKRPKKRKPLTAKQKLARRLARKPRQKTQSVALGDRPKFKRSRAKPTAELTLSEYVRRRGGMTPGGMFAGEVRTLGRKETGTTGLINKYARQGDQKQTPEYAMDAANEAGYRDKDGYKFSNIGDFIDAVADDVSGRKRIYHPDKEWDYEDRRYNPLIDVAVLQKYAGQDMALARREGEIAIAQTKRGTVFLSYDRAARRYKLVAVGGAWSAEGDAGKIKNEIVRLYDVVDAPNPDYHDPKSRPVIDIAGTQYEVLARHTPAEHEAQGRHNTARELRKYGIVADLWLKRPRGAKMFVASEYAGGRYGNVRGLSMRWSEENPIDRSGAPTKDQAKVTQIARRLSELENILPENRTAAQEKRIEALEKEYDVAYERMFSNWLNRSKRHNPRGAQATVTTYKLKTGAGRHIRQATRVTFPNGLVVSFLDKLPKGEAITQARGLVARGYRETKKNPSRADLESYVKALDLEEGQRRARSWDVSERQAGAVAGAGAKFFDVSWYSPGMQRRVSTGQPVEALSKAAAIAETKAAIGYAGLKQRRQPLPVNFIAREVRNNGAPASPAMRAGFLRTTVDSLRRRGLLEVAERAIANAYRKGEISDLEARRLTAAMGRKVNPARARKGSLDKHWLVSADVSNPRDPYAVYETMPVEAVNKVQAVTAARPAMRDRWPHARRFEVAGPFHSRESAAARIKAERASIARHGRRANPGAGVDSRLESLFERFQGRTPARVTETMTAAENPGEGYKLGDLAYVDVQGPRGTVFRIEGGPGAELNASVNDKLYISGLQHARPEGLAGKGRKLYGWIIEVAYRTVKNHINRGRHTEYWHVPGEDNGKRPRYAVNAHGWPLIIGGDYSIDERGIIN